VADVFTEEKAKRASEVGRWVWMVLSVFSFAYGGFLTMGAVKMQNLEAYTLCVAASCAALLPLGWAWPVSLAMGLWCLATLKKPAVQAGFESSKPRPPRRVTAEE
jgi:hypothetical protein